MYVAMQTPPIYAPMVVDKVMPKLSMTYSTTNGKNEDTWYVALMRERISACLPGKCQIKLMNEKLFNMEPKSQTNTPIANAHCVIGS